MRLPASGLTGGATSEAMGELGVPADGLFDPQVTAGRAATGLQAPN